MELLKFFVKTSPRAFVLAIALGVLTGSAAAGLISQVNLALTRGATASIAWVFAAMCLLRVVSGFFGQLQLHHLSQDALYGLRMQLSRAILRTPQRKLEQLGPAKLLAVLSEDVVILSQGGFALAVATAQIGLVAACAVYLGTLSVATLGAVLVVLALGLGVQRLVSRRAWRLMRLARNDQDDMFAGFRGITEGGKELKLHPGRRAAFMSESLERPGQAYRRKHVLGGALLIVASQWMSILFFVLVGLLLFAWRSVFTLDTRILASYVLTILYMQSAIEGVMTAIPHLGRAGAAIEKLNSLGLTLSSDLEATDVGAITTCKRLELRGVTHEYEHDVDDRVFQLGPIDATFQPGEIVFITGGNGSGKSTLVKILTGLYTPRAGEIRVDGDVVTEEGYASYRTLFSAVFSDWYLFDRMTGIRKESVDADARRYLTELGLDKKVSIEGGALSTTALSQGQRKRLMLLTAYLEDRPVYVFDEWASDQDPVFKQIFYTAILKGLKDRRKIVVVVSHDDRYFPTADRILRLESGHVVADPAGSRPPPPRAIDATA